MQLNYPLLTQLIHTFNGEIRQILEWHGTVKFTSYVLRKITCALNLLHSCDKS